MTEESSSEKEGTPDQEERRPYVRNPDYLLQDLVQLANIGVGFGVTLNVGGVLVSGNVVSGRTYIQHTMNDVVGSMKDGPIKTALVDRFKPYLELYPEEPTPEQRDSLPTFIHLTNAKFYTPGTADPTPSTGMLWRGVISDVSGFFFGTLT